MPHQCTSCGHNIDLHFNDGCSQHPRGQKTNICSCSKFTSEPQICCCGHSKLAHYDNSNTCMYNTCSCKEYELQ